MKCLAVIIAKIAIKKIIRKILIFDEVFICFNLTRIPVSYTHLRAHETKANLVCRLLLEKKNIEIGKRNFGKVSVISGLNEGDLVISEGVSKVRDKGKIKIITPTK